MCFTPLKVLSKTLYFEIDKKSGLPFTPQEIKRLKALLKQEIEHCVEKLIPRIFMARNEEEVLKNILTLSREIKNLSDFPEVMILLDQQTTQEAIFTIIVVQVAQPSSLPLSIRFSQIHGNFTFFPERSQTVRYIKKKHPIEASIFRIHLPKDPSILRSDLSINFYLARQKVSALLTQAIGGFRDFNGGIILKQREALTAFIDAIPELSAQNPELLETFFHSISPIEAQASLSITSLTTLFQLFLAAQNCSFTQPSDYFLQFHQNDDELFLMTRLPGATLKTSLDQLLNRFSQSQIITVTLSLQESIFLGYFITSIEPADQHSFKTDIAQALENWKRSIESQKVLKLGLEFPVVSLDPRVGGDHISALLLKMLFEGLMRENREGKIEYGIAQSVEISPDLKTYLFKLRPTRWSDGSIVTAFDFDYAWKKVLSPTFNTPFAYLFYPIKNAELAKSGTLPPDAIGIQALDETTLQVELKSPTPYFLELIAHPIFSPVHSLTDQLHPNWPFEEKSSYICNGAFLLSKNNPRQGYDLIKNSLYWDSQNILLDQAYFFKVSHHQAFERFEKNANHWVGVPLATWDPNFIPNENDEYVSFLNRGAYWYAFNCNKLPFNHTKMRQAFSLAIDRIQLASLFHTQPILSPLPPSHCLLNAHPSAYFNPLKAKILFGEALEEMGLSRETFPCLKLMHLPGSIRPALAKKILQFWEEAFGIHCKVEALEWKILFRKSIDGDYIISSMAWDPWVNDPIYTLNAFRHANEPMNFLKWKHTRYQDILRLAEKEIHIHKRQIYYSDAEQILLDEVPVTSIFASPIQSLKKRELKISSCSSLVNFKWAYFE